MRKRAFKLKTCLQNFDKQIEEYTNKVNILSQDRKNAGEQLAQLNRRISEAEEKVNSITGSRAKMIEEREEIASQLQNVRLEIVTAQKDIDALNSEILLRKIHQITSAKSRENSMHKLRTIKTKML